LKKKGAGQPCPALSIAAGPIGNLEDITLRVIRALQECSFVICEDTRRTLALLSHLGIRKPLESCHAHTSAARVQRLAESIRDSEMGAVFMSDGGTPGISDPGADLVRACRMLDVPVLPLPGASALTAALSVSGFPSNGVFFAGFLPLKPGKRRKALQAALSQSTTLLCYESPHRARALLEDIKALFPQAELLICREMTKMHEEYIFWQAGEDIPELIKKGEYTVVVHIPKAAGS
jgi:16S rRNA (cytidine1402-2'-O)-methyltransferase